MDISKNKESILTLIKLDSSELFNRVKFRNEDYIRVYKQKRTREHFKDIFHHKFKEFPMHFLTFLEKETIVLINQFYSTVDELHWYLSITQDMPNTVEDNVNIYIKKLDPINQNLQLYLEGELDSSQ